MYQRSFTWLTSFGKSFLSKRNASGISLGEWSPSKVVTSGTSFPHYTVSSPSLLTFGGKAVLAFRGAFDNSIFIATSSNSGDTWASYQIPSLQTTSKPALCKFVDKAVLVYRTSSNQLGISSTSDPSSPTSGFQEWLPYQNITLGDVFSPPSVASLGDYLYISYVNSAGLVMVFKSNLTNSTWQKMSIDIPQQDVNAPHISPTLFNYEGTIWIAIVLGNEVKLGRLVNNSFQFIPVALPASMVNMVSMNAVSLVESFPPKKKGLSVFMALKTPDFKISIYSVEGTTSKSWKYWGTLGNFISSGSPAITSCNGYLILAYSSFNVTNQAFDGSGDPQQAQLIFNTRCQINATQ